MQLLTRATTAAKQFAKVVELAGEGKKIRGFATNVSNYNPFNTTFTEEWLEGSNSFDEGHYALSLAPHLEAEGLVSETRLLAPNPFRKGLKRDNG